MLLYVFATSLTMVLSRNTEVINIGAEILRFQCFSLPFLAYFATSSMLMQNIGKYYSSLVISVSRQGIFYIPLLFALPFIFYFGAERAVYGTACGRCTGIFTGSMVVRNNRLR